MPVRLVTGCSWEDAEHLCPKKVSDTTVRARRHEWIIGDVFDRLCTEVPRAYDEIMGIVLYYVAADRSLDKSPRGWRQLDIC